MDNEQLTFYSNEYCSEVTGTLVSENKRTFVLSVVKERERRYRKSFVYYDIPEHTKIIKIKKHRIIRKGTDASVPQRPSN